LVAALLSLTSASTAIAQENGGEFSSSEFAVRRKPDRPRSVFWMPLTSMLVPGLDQWIEGQYSYAAVYTGLSWGGIQYALDNAASRQAAESDGSTVVRPTVRDRKVQLGTMGWQYSGGFSAYQAFRTAVRTQKPAGRFQFLRREESMSSVLLAPFHFQYLARPTTVMPLLFGGWVVRAIYTNPLYRPRQPTADDALYTGVFSWGAGTHEEAFFRGWLMPVMNDAWDSPFWSNVATGALFGAAHMGTISVPWPQTVMGCYFGWLTQRRDWTIGEAVFVHAWWDVLALGLPYVIDDKSSSAVRMPIMLPPFKMVF
jgi:membrane protease YdiL (CAAX protease family)